MVRAASMIATVALLLSADTSGVFRAPASTEVAAFPAVQSSSAPQSQDAPQAGKASSGQNDSSDSAGHSGKAQKGTLQDSSRLTLVRFVDGEIVRVVTAIPAGKKGIHIKAGTALDEKTVRMALASSSGAINPGDHAQITDLQFKDKEIVVDINGGGKGKQRLRDHIHLEVGGAIPTVTTTTSGSETPVDTTPGATIYVDFDKSVPDITPEQLEQYLSGFLDFSKRHSAAVQWVESLPPEIQKAIQDKQPVVGMDHDMVLAALGRPDRKVREKDADGNEIEDWIYGTPPEKTIFVSFEGDKVKEVHQYPQ